MKGLEISRAYFEEFGRPMLERDFPSLMPLLAVGFVGSGSEKFGFDDELSRDHDFEPGFCIFMPDENVLDRRSAFLLERAYSALPKEFMGLKHPPLSPVGGNRCGPMRTGEFYLSKVGSPDGMLSDTEWLTVPDYALAEAVNGEVFFDGYGEFTRIRERLCRMPEDARLKRLAGSLIVMAQSGQYNFSRCMKHGESEAAALAAGEFVTHALRAIFTLRQKYVPYYKWSFRALRALDGGEAYAALLGEVLKGSTEAIEAVCEKVSAELKNAALTDDDGTDLERHAYAVNDKIKSAVTRNMNIFCTI